MSDLFRALSAYITAPHPDLRPVADALGLELPSPAEHHRVFGLELYPYASVYLGAEGMLGGDARDRIAGFWRALGATPPAEPDNLATLLGTYATLAGRSEAPARHACRVLLWEHLLSWLPAWLAKLRAVGGPGYADWGRLLELALVEEARRLGPPEAPPVALARASGLETSHLVEHLLVPVRTGMIITRHDLLRAGRDLGLGQRQGERGFALTSLLAQDATAVIGWLAAEAEAWATVHGQAPPCWREATIAWKDRAHASSGILRRLAAEAREAVNAG